MVNLERIFTSEDTNLYVEAIPETGVVLIRQIYSDGVLVAMSLKKAEEMAKSILDLGEELREKNG